MVVFRPMFFVLSKLLDVAIDPVWWCVGFLSLAAWLSRHERRRRVAVTLFACGLGVLLLAALPSVSNRLWWGLEAGAQKTMRDDVTYDAVVLLGGVVTPQGSLREDPALNESIERLLAVRELLSSGRAKVAVLSGGSLGGGLRTEAEYLALQLKLLGVKDEQLILEDRANNTRENATLSKPLLEARGAKTVLIVTSAFHMPRAVGCFRAAGLDVDTLPVDWRIREPAADTHVMPRGEYVMQTTRALREWLGRLVYAAMGYSK